jgi:hypothetical protein
MIGDWISNDVDLLIYAAVDVPLREVVCCCVDRRHVHDDDLSFELAIYT